MKALFLDRDGIINKERGDYTWRKEDFEFTEGLTGFLKRALEKNYVLIVVTNQGGIEKGLYSMADVEGLHLWMTNELKKEGIDILDIYYCPHHDKFQRCLCRKPGSLLLEKATAIYSIDKENSLMIGDRRRDVEAAERIGIKGMIVDSNPDWSKVEINSLK